MLSSWIEEIRFNVKQQEEEEEEEETISESIVSKCTSVLKE